MADLLPYGLEEWANLTRDEVVNLVDELWKATFGPSTKGREQVLALAKALEEAALTIGTKVSYHQPFRRSKF